MEWEWKGGWWEEEDLFWSEGGGLSVVVVWFGWMLVSFFVLRQEEGVRVWERTKGEKRERTGDPAIQPFRYCRRRPKAAEVG